MPNSPHVKINLIGREKVTVKEDFLKWSIKIGRIIIVATELIALAALLYRFSIDRKIIDLHDKIKNSQILVQSQQAKEASYRSVLARLDNIKRTENSTNVKVGIMNDIISEISNGDFFSTNFAVDHNSIRVDGYSFSIFPINTFIENLKKNPDVVSISLEDVSSTNLGIQFKILIELKGENT